jgi:formiminotetrahydrofolate cyclodeaminase
MTSVVETPIGEYLEGLASTASVPGGGSAAGVAAAMGAALMSMVGKLSVRRATPLQDVEVLQALVPEFDRAWQLLGRLSQDDIDAYRSVTTARKAARTNSGSRVELATAIERATLVPLETARAAAAALDAAVRLRGLVWEMVASDYETGYLLLQTGFKGAMANAAINLPELSGDTRARLDREYESLLRDRPGT